MHAYLPQKDALGLWKTIARKNLLCFSPSVLHLFIDFINELCVNFSSIFGLEINFCKKKNLFANELQKFYLKKRWKVLTNMILCMN